MDGVLVIDKPDGLTSHDVVAAARRALGVERIGHTGTLDPLATGVLPLALGRATRLVRFMSASDKDYDATIRFGLTTDTYDVTGTEVTRTDGTPSRDAVMSALDGLTGDYLQTPPAYSAKKVDGRRAYVLARRNEPASLAPVPVRVSRAELMAFEGLTARIRLTCSAGFYVRRFAHDVGERTGMGACLEALRRTRSGEFDASGAAPMSLLEWPSELAARVVPLEGLLSGIRAVRLTGQGREDVLHGRLLGADDFVPEASGSTVVRVLEGNGSMNGDWIRLLDESGMLVAMATPGSVPGSLHPSVVLI